MNVNRPQAQPEVATSASTAPPRPTNRPATSSIQPITPQRPSNTGLRAAGKAVSSPHDLQAGAVVANRYLVERVIGEGNVSLVVAAKNLDLGELVALKILKPEMLTQPGALARFGREAKASVQIRTEYAGAVYDVGQLPDGTPFLVMEFLDGVDLGQFVATSGALTVSELVETVLQICEALAIAHSKGIIHRDLKPENLFRIAKADGMFVVKVIDFGISKSTLAGNVFGANLAATENLGGVSGTPYYMAPEQMSASTNIDARADIWALGICMYELLTGMVPFPGNSFAELCTHVLASPAPDVRAVRDDVPWELAHAITKCLEKDPNARYANVAELAAALYPFSPKRARLNAERAVAILKAAGMADVNLAIDSIAPPHSSPSMPSIPRTRSGISNIDTGAQSRPSLPGFSSGSSPGARTGNTNPDLRIGTTNPGAGQALEAMPPQPSGVGRLLPVLIGASLALAAVLSIAYFMVLRSGKSETAAAPSAATMAAPTAPKDLKTSVANAPTVAQAPQEAAPVAAPQPAANTAAQPIATTVAAAPPPAARPAAPAWGTWQPPPKKTAAPTATAAPKGKSDEPDLGY